jgi:hypothetical protein
MINWTILSKEKPNLSHLEFDSFGRREIKCLFLVFNKRENIYSHYDGRYIDVDVTNNVAIEFNGYDDEYYPLCPEFESSAGSFDIRFREDNNYIYNDFQVVAWNEITYPNKNL